MHQIYADAVLGMGRWSDYTVERLIAFLQRSSTIEVVTGVLTQACDAIRQGEAPSR